MPVDAAVVPASDAGRHMDAIYRSQRHIYDLTRKYYLFGRDRLLDTLPVTTGARVCEIGCGTGRNLIRLARRRRDLNLYGVDVSAAMLDTATAAIERARLEDRVHLALIGEDGLDPASVFGVDAFDAVFFSYVLSMVPDWRPALDRAASLLRPGGVLAVVDFGDQNGVAAWRRVPLLAWLRHFDVLPRAEIEAGLRTLAARWGGPILDRNIGRGYAYLLMLQKPPMAPAE
jgi:S-adenosylmethionine-diacylgycerolhomoserine-N-methlytransferase